MSAANKPSPSKPGLSPELEKAIAMLLKKTMSDPEATLTDKCKVVDRALKLEALKQKIPDEQFGRGFFEDDEGAENE